MKAPAQSVPLGLNAVGLLREETSGGSERAASAERPARTAGTRRPVGQGRDRPVPSLSRPLPGLPTPYSQCLQTPNTQCPCRCAAQVLHSVLGALPSISSLPHLGGPSGARGTRFQRVEWPGEP